MSADRPRSHVSARASNDKTGMGCKNFAVRHYSVRAFLCNSEAFVELAIVSRSESVMHSKSTGCNVASMRSASRTDKDGIVSTVTSGLRLSILDLAAETLCHKCQTRISDVHSPSN